MSCISLTTDFGTADWFVGAMKGVLLRLNPRAVLVDLCHEVPPGDVRAGAFVLAAGCRFFPAGTVHLAVVDPGVGSARAGLAVETENGFFVGPDNGVLSWALAAEKVRAAWRLENRRYWLQPVSHTFHGRDIFAPVAAHLSRGGRPDRLGPRTRDWTRLPWPEPRAEAAGLRGEVVYVDRFGNALTNIPHSWVEPPWENWRARWGRGCGCPFGLCYAAVPPGRPVAVPGSSGFVEIAVHGGHASRELGLRVGARLRLEKRLK